MDERFQLQLVSDQGSGASASEVATVFDPARLTQARQLAGMTKAAVASKVGVSAAAVSQWEARTSPPRPDHLQRLADELDVPVGFFAVGRPHAQIDASTAHFRSLRSTRSSQRAKAVAYVEQIWELAAALEKRIQLPAVNLPGFSSTGTELDVDTPLEPAAAADALRQRWNLGTGRIPHLVRAMENRGIVVTMTPFAGVDTPRVDAFSTSRPRPLVVLTPDRADDVYRHRFTAAHELGHLLLHRNTAPGDPQQEREADQFAAQFLTPCNVIERQLPARVDFKAYDSISREWGVSIKSLIYRSRELGSISDASARRAYIRLNQLTSLGIFPYEPVARYPGERPSLLSKAFDLAERNGLLTLTDLARELQWRIPRLRLLLGQTDHRPTLVLA